MESNYRLINLINLSDDMQLYHPKSTQSIYSLSDPALNYMTDFAVIEPLTIYAAEPVDIALNTMKSKCVRLLFVLDSSNLLKGIVTAKDLVGRKTLSYMTKMKLTSRAEVTVESVMHRNDELYGMMLDSIENARIGDVVRTLHGHDFQHILIFQSEGKTTKIRGIISITEIASKLNHTVTTAIDDSTFKKLANVLFKNDFLA